MVRRVWLERLICRRWGLSWFEAAASPRRAYRDLLVNWPELVLGRLDGDLIRSQMVCVEVTMHELKDQDEVEGDQPEY